MALFWCSTFAPILPLYKLKPFDVINSLYLSCNFAYDVFPPKSFHNWSWFKNLPVSVLYIALPFSSFATIGTNFLLPSLPVISFFNIFPLLSVSKTFLWTESTTGV